MNNNEHNKSDFFDNYHSEELECAEDFEYVGDEPKYVRGDKNELTWLIFCCAIKCCFLIIAIFILRMISDRSFLEGSNVETYVALEQSNVTDEAFISLNTSGDVKDVIKHEQQILNENETYKNFKKAQETNKDVIGWIRIPNTLINYPIMHRKDNSFYLDHNSKGEKDANGAIFMESMQDDWAFINMLHGHNLKSGKMFGQLVKYKEQTFCEENMYVEIAREGELVHYKIFSVFVADGSNEEFPIQFADYAEYKKYYAQLLGRSMYPLATSVDAEDIIIMNTCSYEFSNAHFIVCAQLMED